MLVAGVAELERVLKSAYRAGGGSGMRVVALRGNIDLSDCQRSGEERENHKASQDGDAHVVLLNGGNVLTKTLTLTLNMEG